jgi:hypothetical protein
MTHHISRAKARSEVLTVGDVGDFHYVKCTDIFDLRGHFRY